MSTSTSRTESTATNYQLVQMHEHAENSNIASSNLDISSLHNTYETIGTTIFNAGKWIVTHPIQSILTGSTLLAIGLGAGLGIPVLINSKSANSISANLTSINTTSANTTSASITPVNITSRNTTPMNTPVNFTSANSTSKSNVKCSELDTLVFGANKGSEFYFEDKQNNSILAKLFQEQTTDNAHVYLNTRTLCKNQTEPEDILKDSIMFYCGNDSITKLNPEDLISQKRINKKLSETKCNPTAITPNLIFKGDLEQGKTNKIELDSQKMCQEGKINNFQVNDYTYYNKVARIMISELENGRLVLNDFDNTRYRTVFHVDVSTYCTSIFDKQFQLDCQDTSYFFTPKVNLTAESVNTLYFGECTNAKSDETPDKTCRLSLAFRYCED